MYDFLVIGGGAAGFFAAINVRKNNPKWKIGIIESQAKVLQKVKISGGGRCNVTNAISDPLKLSKNYPRGGEFLVEPFKKFSSNHTQNWFQKRDVKLKTEKDGRVFPVTDNSQTIIDCFLKEAKRIDLILKERVISFNLVSDNWEVKTHLNNSYQTRHLMVACGSDRRIWKELENHGLKINPEVPSLFTFNINDERLNTLKGISFSESVVENLGGNLSQKGSLLITHWGLSGPVVLKLSAWGAYILNERKYNFKIKVNWIGVQNTGEVEQTLKKTIANHPKKNIRSLSVYSLSQRFWNYICDLSGIGEFQNGSETGKKHIAQLTKNLISAEFQITGKSTFKEEFVTAGGVDLSEVDPFTFKSYKYKSLYLGGEVLDIDAITGGFNFQAAWTAGYLISEDLKEKS